MGLFCCPNHFECMDTTTKSTQGPNCDSCRPPATKKDDASAKQCGTIKAGKYLHLPTHEIVGDPCSGSSCSGVDCGIAVATCAVACATAFPAGCLSCLSGYPACCHCASYELGFDCSYC